MKAMLQRSIETEDKLQLIYLSNAGSISQRVIKVLAVTDTSIKAYCYTKRQFRTFKLVNILSVGPIRKRLGA